MIKCCQRLEEEELTAVLGPCEVPTTLLAGQNVGSTPLPPIGKLAYKGLGYTVAYVAYIVAQQRSPLGVRSTSAERWAEYLFAHGSTEVSLFIASKICS